MGKATGKSPASPEELKRYEADQKAREQSQENLKAMEVPLPEKTPEQQPVVKSQPGPTMGPRPSSITPRTPPKAKKE